MVDTKIAEKYGHPKPEEKATSPVKLVMLPYRGQVSVEE